MRWQRLAWLSVVCLFNAAFFLAHRDPRSGIPDESRVQTAVGTLAWYRTNKDDTSFGLEGHELPFHYAGKSGEVVRVRRYLASSLGWQVRVDYVPVQIGPWWSREPGLEVWGLIIGNVSVRSYFDIEQQWKTQGYLALPMGIFMLGGGVYLGNLALQRRREAR